MRDPDLLWNSTDLNRRSTIEHRLRRETKTKRTEMDKERRKAVVGTTSSCKEGEAREEDAPLEEGDISPPAGIS
ncbi:hypothetical protein F2Q69_00024281 [Brassica cretica]|uniref:Uncharacterized protein n=1 Tax=Brassica cretica TaxID=69181 RepID=A0A8S9Q2G8_BRACR|nr:hypothetical protein F2Q69_00024281 [Brassica cretica]